MNKPLGSVFLAAVTVIAVLIVLPIRVGWWGFDGASELADMVNWLVIGAAAQHAACNWEHLKREFGLLAAGLRGRESCRSPGGHG